jgi:UDP-N-acetylglucosamine transferase subunit ALG13
MMEALAQLPWEDLYVQHGPAKPPPCATSVAYLPFEAIAERMASCDVVVTHAGVGSILCAIRAGHRPIVFPRLKSYGEAVDDHQDELATALHDRGATLVARTPDELLSAVLSAPPRGQAAHSSSNTLVDAVRMAIAGTPAPTAARRTRADFARPA